MAEMVLDEGTVHCRKCGRLVRWTTVAVDYRVVIDTDCLWCGTSRAMLDNC